MSDLCNDNRFKLIEKYKKKLIKSTNIESSQDEMKVLDNILFRFWQMGWLDKLELSSVQSDLPIKEKCAYCPHCENCDVNDDLSITQPELQNARIFQEIVIERSLYNTYPGYKEKPYYSIRYIENGEEHVGYGTYDLEVLSQYLKEYFMPSSQPETSILTVTVNPDSEEIERVARKIKDAPVMVLPSAEPKEDCDTCKHGYFGDTCCNNCKVRFPSHYERRTDEGSN